MCARFYMSCIILVLLTLVGVSVSSTLFPPNHHHVFAAANNLQASGSLLKNQHYSLLHMKEGKYKKIGSKPPRCDHKCNGCMPCEAIQVPTTTSHLGVLYTNYEPEGWKCKCGPSFYSP